MKKNEVSEKIGCSRTLAGRQMVWLLGLAAIALLVVAPRPAHAEMRKFTSADGREITAEIQRGTAEQVTIKLENGKELTSKITVFSDEDQKYIRNWIKTQPPRIDYSFSLSYKRLKDGEKKRSTSSHNITVESWYYEMAVDNRSRVDLEDLEFRYRIFVQSEHEKGRNEKAMYISDGMVQVPSIVHNGRAKPRTKTVPLTKSKLKPDYEYKDGGRDRLSDEMVGLWVKVFHHGRRVWEFKSPHKAVNDGTFTDSEALEIGKPAPKK